MNRRMKRIFLFVLTGIVAALLGSCGTNKSVRKDVAEVRNDSSLVHWMQSRDSVRIPQGNVMDLKAGKENTKRMQNQVNAEKEEPYVGGMLYHLFRDILKR